MTMRTIPKPDPEREPMKVNVFRYAQACPTTLAPLFPYLDEGAIVPCVSTFRGGRRYGRFQHFNTVDEVAVMWGNSGARRAAGLVHVGPKLHLVAPMDSDNPDDTGLIVITQRQSIGKEQREEVRFICEKCDRRLFIHALDATPPKRGTQAPGIAPFITLAGSYEAARLYNADEAGRLCKHCGHQNPPFPLENWAWDFHISQSQLADVGAKSLAAAQQAGPPREQGTGGR